VNVRNGYIRTSGLKSERCGNSGDSRTFDAVIGLLLIFACILRTSLPKMFLGGKMEEGGVFIPTN